MEGQAKEDSVAIGSPGKAQAATNACWTTSAAMKRHRKKKKVAQGGPASKGMALGKWEPWGKKWWWSSQALVPSPKPLTTALAGSIQKFPHT